MAIDSGSRPRARRWARRWARRLYDAYPEVHGIHYASSRHADPPAVALFERAAVAMPSSPELLRPLADPGLEPLVRETALAIWHECLWRAAAVSSSDAAADPDDAARRPASFSWPRVG